LGKIPGRHWLKAAAQIFSKNPLQVPEIPALKVSKTALALPWRVRYSLPWAIHETQYLGGRRE
jgi:hypothetical protein